MRCRSTSWPPPRARTQRLRKLVKNMVYVGVAAQLLSIDMELVEKTVRKQFAKKVKAAELNLNAVRVGFDYAASTLTKQDPYVVERDERHRRQDHHRWQCRRGDGRHVRRRHRGRRGIPSRRRRRWSRTSSTCMKKYRVEKDGKASFAIVQAEDELAAIGMVLGAGWAGARAMTASSGPGISLMAEFAGLGYYAETSRRHLRHSAHRPLHWPAHAYLAGRPHLCRRTFPWRYQARHVAAGDR